MSDIENKDNQSAAAAPSSAGVGRRWLFLPILDFYILREFLIPFTVLIIGFILLFLVGDLFNDLKDFLGDEAQYGNMLRYFVFKLPGNIRFVLPLSVLLACMYTMAHMGKNMEITAIRASGISLMRSCGSIFVVAIMVVGVNFWFNETVVPYTEREAFILIRQARNPNFLFNLHNMLTYRSMDNERTWLFRHFAGEGIHEEVILKKSRTDDPGKLEWDVRAERAEFIPEQGWRFHQASFTPYGADGLMPGGTVRHEVLDFDMDAISETPKEIMDMVKPPEDLPSWDILNLLSRTTRMPPNIASVYYTIFFYRLAFPWASLLAVFLAVPLAASSNRGGVMGSVVKAVIIIVAYQLLSEAALIVGKRGIVPAALAGLGPTIAFVIYGWRNVNKQI